VGGGGGGDSQHTMQKWYGKLNTAHIIFLFVSVLKIN